MCWSFYRRFAKQAANVKIFATSREVVDVGIFMDDVHADQIIAAGRLTDSDIRSYVSTQMSLNSRLCRLEPELKTEVADTLAQKADGM